MAMIARSPIAPLRPFVRLLWVGFTPPTLARPGREHVLPTGHMHLALRWGGPPLRLFDGAHDPLGHSPGHAVLGGARCAYYAKRAGDSGWSVGAQLEPGAAGALLRTSAANLAERHTPLADVCGPGAVAELMERLQAQSDPEACLRVLETWLLARMARTVRGLHPAIAAALASLHTGAPVQQAVQASGLSHRHLIAHFRDATGLAPKQHARVLRLQLALAALQAPAPQPAGIAADAGFADQAHFTREFRALTGVTPTDWLRAAPAQRNHVRVG
jgi:AraC-like DNA-binding protein